jgi:parvulin-like peptidyl-prolyl isomerase
LAEERGLARSDPRQTIDALLGAEPAAEPTADEISRYFAEHGADFRRPERVRLRQILVEDRQEAERARRQLAAGEPFASVAERVSRDARATAGGEQGELTRDDLPPAFADLIFALPDGGISQVIEADYGCLVFQVVAHLPAQELALAQAEPEIRRQLVRRRADDALRRLVAEAQSRYAVQIYDRNLPFEYHGSFPIARPLEGR